jgi:hypothetical protein
MGHQTIRTALLLILFLTKGLFLSGQVVGESKISKFNLKKPVALSLGSEELSINDIAPPGILIITPQTDTTLTAHLSSSGTYLSGRLTDDSDIRSFSINDSLINIDAYGFFQERVHLKEGLNVFKMVASDEKSNSVTQFLQLVLEPQSENTEAADPFENPGNYYGLIIAVNNYSDSALVDLDHPITDASFLYSTLMGNYIFEPENLTLLRDPTRADIIRTLDKMSHELTPSDNLLIFYAGHGHWDKERETGYWMPSDAEQYSSVNWIRNSTIQDYVNDMDTRHTLVISDACFAGSILKKTRSGFEDASIAINKLYALPSRKAMTSGNLQEVPDRSVFIAYFLDRLRRNKQKYISTGQLFYDFREAVLNNSPNVPLYGVIQDAGDEGGEFIFIRR